MTRSSAASVKGPTSALSSFLRERGIQTGARLNWRTRTLTGNDEPVTDEQVEQLEDTTQEQAPSDEQEETVQFAAPVRRRRVPVAKGSKGKGRKKQQVSNSDDDDDDLLPSSSKPIWSAKSAFPRPAAGDGETTCQRCGQVGASHDQTLCQKCLHHSTLAAAKKKKKPAKKGKISSTARPDRQCLVDLRETGSKVMTLQNICIQVLSAHINEVESFGMISESTREKLSLILSKHRAIDDDSIELFLEDHCLAFHVYDCAKLTLPSFNKIAYFGASLVSLKLHECGQLRDESVELMAQSMQALKTLSLHGCYLVTDKALSLVAALHCLEEFSVSDSPKLSGLTVKSLCESRNLVNMELKGCSTLDDNHLIEFKNVLEKLEQLSFVDCLNITDVSAIVNNLSERLTSLNLTGSASGLTEIELLAKLPSSLCSLNLSGAKCIDVKVISKACPKLVSLTLCRTIDPLLNCESLKELTLLEELNLNGQKEITPESLTPAFEAMKLLTTVDVSWLVSFDDTLMSLSLTNNPNMSSLSIWGCNRLTEFNKLFWNRKMPGLKIIG